MNEQENFDFSAAAPDVGAARRSDPQTSHDAAESIKPSYLHGIIVETLLKARTGLTTHEMAADCGISWGSITPRMPAMRAKGLIYWTGEKRAWAGSPGNPASTRLSMVWQLVSLRDLGAS